MEIILIGKAGMRGRYNPWDIEMKIETKDQRHSLQRRLRERLTNSDRAE